MAKTTIPGGYIEAGSIDTASLADISITADKLHTTLDLTGKTITVATATAGDNDTTAASTAFVSTALALKAPLASPTFTGTVEIPNLTISSAQGSDGQVLTSTGSGIAWEDAAGGVDGIVSSADATAITIDSNENVGIKESSPSATLHTNSGTANIGIHQESTDSGSYISFSDNSTTSISHVLLGAVGNDLVFNAGDTERMRITDAGDITMSGTGSLKVPSGTTAQRPSSPTNGMLRYNTSNSEFEVYNGMWLPMKTVAPLAFQQASTYHRRWTIAADGQSAQAGSGYTAITVNLNFEGNFIIISKWSHDYMGVGIGYKSGITNGNFTGESNDPVGPYGGDVNGDGFDSTVSYMGQYHWPISGGGANTHQTTYYIKHQRAGNTISTHYSTNAASATDPNHTSWTQVQSATIASTDHCKPVWGEASSIETVALTLLYNDITGGFNGS
jgi:hypothetical protein